MVCIAALPLVEWDEPVIAISSAVSSIPSTGFRARHHDLHRKQECSHEMLLSEAKLACIGCDVPWDFAVLSITVSLLHTLLYTGLSRPHSHIWEKQSRPHSTHPRQDSGTSLPITLSLRPPWMSLVRDLWGHHWHTSWVTLKSKHAQLSCMAAKETLFFLPASLRSSRHPSVVL